MKQARLFSAIMLLAMSFSICAQADRSSSSDTLRRVKSGSVPVYLISQEDIPAVIKHPGEYILAKSVKYSGSHSAITIAANNVKLNLRNCSIILENSDATGISIIDSSEVVIEADAIVNICHKEQHGNGIHVCKSSDVQLQNVYTKHHHNGILVTESRNVSIVGSEFFHPWHSGVTVKHSIDVSIDNCEFEGSKRNGLVFSNCNRDCRVTNSKFPYAQQTNMLVEQITGMMVANCSFTDLGGDSCKTNIVQFGDVVNDDQIARDIIFENCTITNRAGENTNTNIEGLALVNVAGMIIDSCIIDIDNTGSNQEDDLSAIHIGDGSGLNVGSDIVIRNSIVEGPAMNGIYPDVGSFNIVIDNVSVSNALKNGIFLAGTSASVVKNSTITNNGTNGIFVGEESQNNLIVNNFATSNGHSIIEDSSLPQGAGIGFDESASDNLVQNNQAFANEGMSFQDFGTHNFSTGNSSF